VELIRDSGGTPGLEVKAEDNRGVVVCSPDGSTLVLPYLQKALLVLSRQKSDTSSGV